MQKELISILWLTLVVSAQAQSSVTFIGRMLDNGEAATGVHKLTFVASDAEFGGTEIWREEHEAKIFEYGEFNFLLLGTKAKLPSQWRELWLHVLIDDSITMPTSYKLNAVEHYFHTLEILAKKRKWKMYPPVPNKWLLDTKSAPQIISAPSCEVSQIPDSVSQGVAVIELIIDKNGNVVPGSATVLQARPKWIFDTWAEKCVSTYKYTIPRDSNGKPRQTMWHETIFWQKR